MVTGSRIVSPLTIVRKSNIPALSKKVLPLVRCLVLQKLVGSVLKQVSPLQKCSILREGSRREGLFRRGVVSSAGHGYGARLATIRVPTGGKWVVGVFLEEDFDSCQQIFPLPRSGIINERSCPEVLWGILSRLNEGDHVSARATNLISIPCWDSFNEWVRRLVVQSLIHKVVRSSRSCSIREGTSSFHST